MSNNLEYRYRILRNYGLLVDWVGNVSRQNVPKPNLERETLNQWLGRTFDIEENDPQLLFPVEARLNSQMHRLIGTDAALKIVDTLRWAEAEHRGERNAVRDETESVVRHQMATVPRQTVEDLREELSDRLEPSVIEFMERQLMPESGTDLDVEDILRQLIVAYNAAVRAAHTARSTEPDA